MYLPINGTYLPRLPNPPRTTSIKIPLNDSAMMQSVSTCKQCPLSHLKDCI